MNQLKPSELKPKLKSNYSSIQGDHQQEKPGHRTSSPEKSAKKSINVVVDQQFKEILGKVLPGDVIRPSPNIKKTLISPKITKFNSNSKKRKNHPKNKNISR